jgi:hypothetical protein
LCSLFQCMGYSISASSILISFHINDPFHYTIRKDLHILTTSKYFFEKI